MLSFRLHMEFLPQNCDEAAAVLRSLVGPVRAEAGCSATRLLRDTEDGCSLGWVEEWRSLEDFERHLREPAFRRILAVIELAAAPPDVEIDDVLAAWFRAHRGDPRPDPGGIYRIWNRMKVE